MQIDDIERRLQEKAAKQAELMRNLSEGRKLRELLGLPADSHLKIQKVKPSGASMAETHKHFVRVTVNGQLFKQIPLLKWEKLTRG